MVKFIIEILHWTPFGFITVPLFRLTKDDQLEFAVVNGLWLGAQLAAIITLLS